jgi:hypothetical protein
MPAVRYTQGVLRITGSIPDMIKVDGPMRYPFAGAVYEHLYRGALGKIAIRGRD